MRREVRIASLEIPSARAEGEFQYLIVYSYCEDIKRANSKHIWWIRNWTTVRTGSLNHRYRDERVLLQLDSGAQVNENDSD